MSLNSLKELRSSIQAALDEVDHLIAAHLQATDDKRDRPLVDLSHLDLETERAVSRVFVHYSYSDNPSHDNVETIRRWHLARGFSDVGYHFFVRKNGRIEKGRDLDKTPAAQKGNNTGTIAICLHGKEENYPSPEQEKSLRALCMALNFRYDGLTFHGHKEVADTSCPGSLDYKGILGLNDLGVMV